MKQTFDFAGFYESYYQASFRYACAILAHEEDAQDVAGDVWLRMWKIRDSLDMNINVPGFLFSMIRNRCLDHLRRRKCHHKIEIDWIQTADRFSDDEFEALCQKEMFRLIGQTLFELSDTQRRVFYEVRIRGKSHQYLVDNTHLSKRAVEYHLARATLKVRKCLKPMYG